MKTISIQVTDEEHKEIKMAATDEGMSIKDYLLAYRLEMKPPREPLQKIGTPKSGLEDLPELKSADQLKDKPVAKNKDVSFKKHGSVDTIEENWTGPMYRKKGKI